MLKCIAVGTISKHPEHKVSEKGVHYLRFQIECSPQGDSKYPDRVRVTVFGKQSDTLATQLAYDDLISLSGKPKGSGYQNRNGEIAGSLDVVADSVVVLRKGSAAEFPKAAVTEPSLSEEDIPF